MGKGNDSDFASVIEQAQRLPDFASRQAPDLSSPFPMPIPPDHRVVDESDTNKIPGVVEWDYQCHIEYYSIPEQKSEYEDTMNDILNGDAILRWEKETFTKEGDFIVVVCYLTRKPNAARAAARARKDEDEEREELIRGR